MHEIEMLEDICEVLNNELSKVNKKLEKANGEMSTGDLDYVDKLTHAIKSVKTTLAMLEGGYSNEYRMPYSRAQRRDSRGRYSREGYSYAGDNHEMIEELKGLMHEAKDTQTREEFKHFIQRLESL